MIWYDNLYLGKSIRRSYPKLRRQITSRQVHPCVYLIVLPQSDHAVLEIIPSLVCIQQDYPTDGLCVVGMASTKTGALLLMKRILSDVWRAGDAFDVSAYLTRRSTGGAGAY